MRIHRTTEWVKMKTRDLQVQVTQGQGGSTQDMAIGTRTTAHKDKAVQTVQTVETIQTIQTVPTIQLVRTVGEIFRWPKSGPHLGPSGGRGRPRGRGGR